MAASTSPRSRSDEQTRTVTSMAAAVLRSPLADFYLILGVAAALIAFGVTMVLSASSVVAQHQWGDPYYFLKRQALFLVVGALMCWWLMRRNLSTLRSLGWIGIFGATVLLVAAFVPGIGVSVNGNRNWIQLGTSWLRVQPSEFAKLAMIVWGASVLATHGRKLEQPKWVFFPFVFVCLILAGLVMGGGDLGTVLVMLAIMMGMLWVAGVSYRILAAFVPIGGLGVWLMVLISPSRVRRLGEFLAPGGSEQALRSMYALASGGWWGRGLGQSRQKWGSLPEAHTDFVFAIIGEELGLIGSLVVVALFFGLGFVGLRVAMRSDQTFPRIAAAGVTLWFMIQASINILVVLRLLPVLGVPLPFISYGGSALLASMLALGVLLACARNEPDARRVLDRKPTTPRPRLSTIVDGGRS